MAGPSSDGRGVSSPLPQLLKRLSSGRSSDGGPEVGTEQESDSLRARISDNQSCRKTVAIDFLWDQKSTDAKENCDLRVP